MSSCWYLPAADAGNSENISAVNDKGWRRFVKRVKTFGGSCLLKNLSMANKEESIICCCRNPSRRVEFCSSEMSDHYKGNPWSEVRSTVYKPVGEATLLQHGDFYQSSKCPHDTSSCKATWLKSHFNKKKNKQKKGAINREPGER